MPEERGSHAPTAPAPGRGRRPGARGGGSLRAATVAAVAAALASSAACYHVAQVAHLLLPPPNAPAAPLVYARRCSSCHGGAGRGDGAAGLRLDTRPRDFGDAAWQAATSDERIRRVIREGGAAVGLSRAMAAHPDLTQEELDALVAYVRRVGQGEDERDR